MAADATVPSSSFDALFAGHNDRRELLRRARLHRAGDPMSHAYLITHGWFGRFRTNIGGAGAFTAIYLPGDVIGLDALPTGLLHDEVTALMDGAVLRLPLQQLADSIADGGEVAREAVRRLAADSALLREALFAVGAQSSTERLSTFTLQTHDRVIAAGLTLPGGGFRMPLTQVQLGAVTGLTSVHVNRVLRRLRLEGLIDFQNGIMRVLDLAGLRRATQRRL